MAITEIVEFELKEGVNESEFIEAFDKSRNYFGNCEGYIDSKLIRLDEKVWADQLHWESMELAHAAAKGSKGVEDAIQLNNLLNLKSAKVKRYEIVKDY